MRRTTSRTLRSLVVIVLALPLAVPIGTAYAQLEPSVEWISESSGEIGGRELPAISADGRYVVFVGRSSSDMGVWVRDRVAGETLRLTSGSHFNPAISADGRTVAYAQFGGASQGIYVLDWQTSTTPQMVSVDDDGQPAGVPVDFPALSGDGRYVAFQASSKTLDDDAIPGPAGGGPSKIYVRDRQLGDTEMVSVTSEGQIVNGNANRPDITPDGRYVVFSSDASILAGGEEVAALAEEEEEEETTVVHVYRHDRQTGATAMASVASDGTPGDGASALAYGPTVSDDGAKVAFESDSTNLVVDDTNGNTDAFVHDFTTGSTERVSLDASGVEVILLNPETTTSTVTVMAPPEEGESVDLTSNAGAGPAISGNGRYVAFESDAALTSDDLNTSDPLEYYQVTTAGGTYDVPVYTTDVYRVNLDDGTLVRSSAALGEGASEASGLRTDGMGSTAPSNNGADPAINVDGRLVAFVSNGNLNGLLPPPEEEDHEETVEALAEPVPLWEPEVWARYDPTINDLPVAGNDQATVRHDRTVTIDVLANDSDPNLDPLTVTAASDPVHGKTTINANGTVTYVPDGGYVGTDTFTYTVDDGFEGTATGTVTVRVTNAAPVALDDTARAIAGTAKVLDVLANDSDPDGDTLAVTAINDPPDGGTATIVGGAISYRADSDFAGFDSFTYVVSDGAATDTATVTLTVTAVGGIVIEANLVRTFGATRIETAIELSEYAFPTGADTVVLARFDQYPDALAGAPLAKALGAPILLTPSDHLDDGVADEIERLGASRAYLLGGEVALTPAVASALSPLGVGTVTRIGGPTRFETAALIANRVVTMTSAMHAYVAEGADGDPMRGWPDALSVSALAAYQGHPILLVTTENLPTATADALADLGLTSATVVGGPVAVSDQVLSAIDGVVTTVDRVFGTNRYATSVAVADASLDAGTSAARTWLATGLNWPDSLVAGPLVAMEDGVLLLIDGVDLDRSPESSDWLTAHAAEFELVRIVGGPAAVSDGAAADIAAIVP